MTSQNHVSMVTMSHLLTGGIKLYIFFLKKRQLAHDFILFANLSVERVRRIHCKETRVCEYESETKDNLDETRI